MAELDLNDVAMFVRVIEHAGFAKASRVLGVPTSTVSRAVSRLEQAAGARLVHRNTRNVSATSEGQSFYREVAPLVVALRQAARGVEDHTPEARGTLRISAPNDLGATFVAGLVSAFSERYPRVTLHVELSVRNVDLVREGFDVALRASDKLSDSSLVARKAGELEAELYAAPSYIAAFGAPADVASLAEHRCVLFRPERGGTIWRLDGPEGLIEQAVRGPIGGDDYLFVRAVALWGAGVALLPRMVAADDVAAGRLVRVLPRHAARGAALYVVYAGTRTLPAKVAAFRDFVLSSCRGGPGRAAALPSGDRHATSDVARTGPERSASRASATSPSRRSGSRPPGRTAR
jgi:DNA-binding transcriptional LysR family regulator